jgi:hypothetical protein
MLESFETFSRMIVGQTEFVVVDPFAYPHPIPYRQLDS